MLTPTGRYDENAGYYGQMPTSGTEDQPIQTIDFYGAILRRKFVIILLALFGAGIGYLFYQQASPVYASSLRLMLWVQSPPTIVNGEVVAQTVSMSKQQNLIASQTVLSNALRKGELQKLDTFKDSLSPLGALKKMLRIVPVDKTADALDLTLTGPYPKDLPTILEEIVAAYISINEEDSAKLGRESVELIRKLQDKLEGDQKLDQKKYFDLLTELKLTSENDSGKWINPFSADIQRLKQERDATAKSLEDFDQKLRTLRLAFETKAANGANEIWQLMVLEAKKALQITDERAAQAMERIRAEDQAAMNRIQTKLDFYDSRVFEFESQLEDALRKYGPQHATSLAISSNLARFTTKRDEIEKERAELEKAIGERFELAKIEEGINQDSKKKDDEILRLYVRKLNTEKENSKKFFDKVSTELAGLEENSKAIAAKMAEVNMLKEQINERRDAVAKILDKLSAINVLSDNNYTYTKVRVIDPASNAIQVAPKLLTYLAIGIIAAGLLGVGLAILIDQSDLSYRTPIDIQHSLAVPVICKIPKIKTKKALPNQTGSPILVSAFNPQSPASETFRAARTALLFSAHQNNGKVFLFTSPSPGDGKSTTSSNLAISLAQTKKRVILVDADFRRPRVQQNFGIQIEPGCVEVLSGELPLEQAIRPCEFQSNLSLLTTGGRPKDAGELIASTEFAKMIEQLKESFDFIIIDSPPILPVADSTSLSSIVDGIFLVLRIRRGVMLAAYKAKERLDMVQAKVLGVIVNGMDENVYYSEYGMYYRGGYYSGYGKYYESQNSSYAEKAAIEAKPSKKSAKV